MKYYYADRENHLKKAKEYRLKHIDKFRMLHRKVSKKWLENNLGKAREAGVLKYYYGTSKKIPLEIKKWEAFVHLGKRINPMGSITIIEVERIKEIINYIEKGETYKAYE